MTQKLIQGVQIELFSSTLGGAVPSSGGGSTNFLRADGTWAVPPGLVTSFNTRTGAITLTSGDVTTALGYTPAQAGANTDITSLTGLTGGISTADYLNFDLTAAAATGIGRLTWDATYGTLQLGLVGGNVNLQLGQELNQYVLNKTGSTLLNGKIVRVNGAQGNRPTVTLAQANTKANCSGTIGMLTEDIANNLEGFVTTYGLVHDLDTSAFTDGDRLFLSSTTAGEITNVQPASPNFVVVIGYVIRAHATVGQILITINEGLDLSDMADVDITTPATGNILVYNSGTGIWANQAPTFGTVTSVAASVPSFLSIAGSPITTSGTLAITLSGTALPAINGGTGQTSFTTGDILYASSSTALSKLGVGSTGQVLTVASGLPSWAAAGASSSNTYKEAVRVATTGNATLASAFENGDAIDGITLATGDRILIKNQTTASENGIYTVNASGAPTRATDFDTTGAEVANGAIIPVQFGTRNGGSTWQLITNGGTIGNSFVFAPMSNVAIQGIAASTPAVASGTNSIAIGSGANASATAGISIGTTIAAGSTSSMQLNIGASITPGTGSGGSTFIGSGTVTGAANSIFITPLGRGLTSSTTIQNSIAIGGSAGLATNSTCAIVLGDNSLNESNSEVAFGLGVFAAVADMKLAMVALRMTTTNATATELGTNTNGSISGTTPTGRLVLSNDSSYIFDCDIIARNTDNSNTDSAAWNLKFAIKRDAAAANTALIGTATKIVIGQDAAASTWDVTVSADTTNGRPKIEVTGEASKTIRWVANIRMTKVTG